MSNHFFRPLRLTIRRAAVPLVAFAMIALPGSALAQGKDDMWEITSKMEMPGMPMAMPAQTSRMCTAKNRKDEDLIPRRENCKLLDSNRSGNKITYKMACTGKDAMNVTGEMTYGANSYEGKMMMTGQAEGQAMNMTQTFSGKRVGDCTAK